MSNSEWGDICLVFNALIWVFIFIIYQYKTRYFGVGSGILLLYTVISVLAINLYHSEYSYMFEDLTLFPFIYLFLMILLASYPILTIGEKHIKRIEPPDMRLFNIVCIGLIIFSFVSLPQTITQIRENLVSILIDETIGNELYGEKAMDYTTKTASQFNILGILGGVSGNLAVVFFMYYMMVPKNKVILIGLLISSLLGPLNGIASGSRAVMAMFIFNVLFLFIFIRKVLPIRMKKKIIKICLIGFSILLLPFITITFSRNKGDIEQTLLSVETYIAQGPLLFNNYCLDANGTREGDYTAVAFKYIAGLDPAMYYSGRLNKYSHMKINESLFYTFVGDFTLDYGPIWAVIIFIVTACFFKKCLKVRDGTVTFHQYLIFYLLMVGCLGYFQFPWGRENGNLEMIALLFVILLFKFSHDLNTRKEKVL